MTDIIHFLLINFCMPALISLCVFLVFFWQRNNWIFRKRMQFIDRCYLTIKQHLRDEDYEVPSVSELVEKCLWSYDKAMWRFWIWDFGKMIKDKELYNKFFKGSPTDSRK